MMSSDPPNMSVAETLADKIALVKPGGLPATTARKCEDLLIDVVGLCVTARNEDYVASALTGCDDEGICTVVGHPRLLSASGAAFVNGTAAHGEDFDDTFEGGPVHAGAVIVPAVLAACERHRPERSDGADRHRGRDRSALPPQPGGAEGRAQGRLPSDRGVRRDGSRGGRRRRARPDRAGRSSTRSASPAAWPAASSNISPRAPGPSACMPAGPRNPASAPRCWRAPASSGRAPCSRAPTACSTASRTRPRATMTALIGDFGERWVTDTIAFKPYPCGTMAQPYIDCARRMAARGIRPEDIAAIVCEVGGGDRAPAVGAAGRQAAPAERLCREIRRALSAGDRVHRAAASGSAPSPKARSAIPACSRSPPRCSS